MASITILANEKNRSLVRALQAKGQNIKMRNGQDSNLIISGDRIEITREMANEHLGLDNKSDGDASIIWRSLILNRTGKLLTFTDNIIIIADEEEKGEWSSVRIRRATKDLGEEWSDKLNVSQSQLYDDAIHFYIASFAPGELEKLQKEDE